MNIGRTHATSISYLTQGTKVSQLEIVHIIKTLIATTRAFPASHLLPNCFVLTLNLSYKVQLYSEIIFKVLALLDKRGDNDVV